MTVLLSGHGDDLDLVNAARRAVAYRTLVLLTPEPADEAIARMREVEALAKSEVRVRKVDARDMLGCLRTAVAEIEAARRPGVRVHIGGGPNLLTNALLLAAFQAGVEAFLCHAKGTTFLPVPQGVSFEEAFTVAERAVLLRLAPGRSSAVEDLADPHLGTSGVRTVLYRLRRRGLVEASPASARLTATGVYYRAHLERFAERVG